MKHIKTALVALMVVGLSLGLAGSVFAHEGQEEENEKPELIYVQPDSLQMTRDFTTIREEVKSSTSLIVIKAVALALSVAGLVLVYLPRKGTESENE